MKALKWIFFAFVFLFLVVFAASGQTTTTVDDGHQLCISSFPDGANVSLDGTTLQQFTPLCVNKITPGQHLIAVSSPSAGWQTDTRTITVLAQDSNGRVRDTHLSFTLMPSLTTGPAGPQGPPGAASTVPGPMGPQGFPGVSIVGPQGIQGIPGVAGANGLPGVPGANGINGAPGLKGDTGATGPAGQAGSGFAGIWNPSASYSQGQLVLRSSNCGQPVCGTPGPFFNLTGSNAGDPAADATNWIYMGCCSPPSVGYSQPVNFADPQLYSTTFAPGAGLNVYSYTFTIDNPATFSQLIVNVQSLVGPTQQQTTTAQTACVAQSGNGNNLTGLPTCNPSSPPSVPNGCSFITVFNSNWNEYSCLLTKTITVQLPPGNLTWTVQKNGVATGLTVTCNSTGTFTSPPTSPVSFAGGDTIELALVNPSTVTDAIVATWTIQ